MIFERHRYQQMSLMTRKGKNIIPQDWTKRGPRKLEAQWSYFVPMASDRISPSRNHCKPNEVDDWEKP